MSIRILALLIVASAIGMGQALSAASTYPSVTEVAEASQTLVIADKTIPLTVVYDYVVTGIGGPKPIDDRPRMKVSINAVVSVEGEPPGEEAPHLSVDGLWDPKGTVNGEPMLMCRNTALQYVKKLPQLEDPRPDGKSYRRQMMVVGIKDGAGGHHLVKVNGWYLRPSPIPP